MVAENKLVHIYNIIINFTYAATCFSRCIFVALFLLLLLILLQKMVRTIIISVAQFCGCVSFLDLNPMTFCTPSATSPLRAPPWKHAKYAKQLPALRYLSLHPSLFFISYSGFPGINIREFSAFRFPLRRQPVHSPVPRPLQRVPVNIPYKQILKFMIYDLFKELRRESIWAGIPRENFPIYIRAASSSLLKCILLSDLNSHDARL